MSRLARRATVARMSLQNNRKWRRIVRFGFRLLYNEMAWTYDIVSWLVSLGEWRNWQEAALPFVHGQRVLEIAHGPGHMLLALAHPERSVFGLDASPTMGRLAVRRIARVSLPVALVRGQVQKLPFPAQIFDTVFSTFPTEFMSEKKTMEAVYRVLRAGGRYVIVPEGHLTGDGLVERFIAWLFTVTGQRDGVFAVDDEATWPAHSPRWQSFRRDMEHTGFRLEVHHVRLQRSAVTVIVATRDASPGPG